MDLFILFFFYHSIPNGIGPADFIDFCIGGNEKAIGNWCVDWFTCITLNLFSSKLSVKYLGTN